MMTREQCIKTIEAAMYLLRLVEDDESLHGIEQGRVLEALLSLQYLVEGE